MANNDSIDTKSTRSSTSNRKTLPFQMTLEPLIIMITISYGVVYTSSKALWISKICLSMYDTEVCDNIRNASLYTEHKQVQIARAHWIFYEMCTGFVSIFTSLVYAYLFDTYSRRLTFFLPVIGFLISTSLYCYVTSTVHVSVWWLWSADLIASLCGGAITMMNSAYAYVAVVCRAGGYDVSVKFAMLRGLISLSSGITLQLSGYIGDVVGLQATYWISIGFLILQLFYIAFILPELVRGEIIPENRIEKKLNFSMAIFTSNIKIFSKKRPNQGRLIISLIFVISVVITLSQFMGILYLYLRLVFDWSNTLFGVYMGLDVMLQGAFLMFVLPLIIKYTNLPVHKMILVGMTSCIICPIYMGSSVNSAMVLSALTFNVVVTMGYIGMRTVLTSNLESDETSRTFMALGICEKLALILNAYLFDKVFYPHCVRLDAPRFIFAWSTGIMFAAYVLSWYLYTILKKYPNISEDSREVQEEKEMEAKKDIQGEKEDVHV